MGKTWCFKTAVSEKHHDETICCCAFVQFIFTRGLLYYQIWSEWGRKPATKAHRVCLIAQHTAGGGRETAANLEKSVHLLNVITGFLQNWVSHCRTWLRCMSVSGAKLKSGLQKLSPSKPVSSLQFQLGQWSTSLQLEKHFLDITLTFNVKKPKEIC